MSTALKQIFEQVHKLSRAEQLLLLSSIAQLLSEKETGQVPEDAMDKSIDPTDLFGIWSGSPRNLQEIRQKAWDRN